MGAFADWIATLPLVRIAVALLGFVVVFLLLSKAPPAAQLDGRVKAILRGTDAGRDEARDFLAHPLRWLSAQLDIEDLRQRAVDWVWDQSPMGHQRRLFLRRAGLRAPRSYLYFEMARLALAVVIAVATFVTAESSRDLSGSTLMTIAMTILGFLAGLYLPEFYLKRLIAARRAAFADYWDDAVGLLIICLDAGLSIEVAMRRIAQELAASAPVLAEELVITVADLSLLKERRLAYLNLAERIDLPGVKSVAIALVQAEKQGASIANSLRTIWQSNRQARITRAEARAASLGPKMTVPMIVFFLPVVFVIIVSPIVLTAKF